MTARAQVVPVESSEAVALLRELVTELRELRADLRRRGETGAPELVAALADYFGAGRFTVSGILGLVEDAPHGAIADALAETVDLGAAPRGVATQLGALLSRLPQVEVVASRRGCAVYRVLTSGE